MIQFLILGAAAFSAGLGIGSGLEGLSKKEEAKKIAEAAEKRYRSKEAALKCTVDRTKKRANEYHYLQIQIKQNTVRRFVNLVEQLQKKYSISDTETQFFLEFEGVPFTELDNYRKSVEEATNVDLDTAFAGVLMGGGAGVVVADMALGGLLLGGAVGGAVIGAALMGFSLAAEGETALTQAAEYEAQVEVEVAKMNAYIGYLKDGVQRRIQELEEVLKYLDYHCQIALDDLEIAIQQGFNIQRDAEKYQRAVLLVKALMEIMRTPLLDRQGNLNPEHTRLLAAYR
ncbi:hypothetical protein [Thermosynechococcus sp. FA-CM-4201]